MKKGHQQLLLGKIAEILGATQETCQELLIELCEGARRIFVAGAGRSGLVARFFAMRLMHAGYEVFVVGEIVTPSIFHGDVLLVLSGSGETETMLAFTRAAKRQGATIALVTTRARSSIGDLADHVLQVGSPELYGKIVGMPMGTAFELSTLFLLEATIASVIHQKGIREEEMRTRHANLE